MYYWKIYILGMYYWNVLFNLFLLIPMNPNTISEGTATPRNVIIPQTLPRKVRLDP